MKKVIEFGKVDYNQSGRKNCLVTLEIELKENSIGMPVFSVCGNIWNANKTDIVWGGQCVDDIYNQFKSQIKNRQLYKSIMVLWENHHLNDLNAGTPEQTAAIEAWKQAGNKYDYTSACEYLKSISMYVVNLNGSPYTYGHSWLYREIPSEDLALITKIISEA